MLQEFQQFQNFICQKVLPLVYGESLSYLETLEKLSLYVNEMVESVNETIISHNDLSTHYEQTLNQLESLHVEIDSMKKENYLIKDGSIELSKLSNSCMEKLQDFVTDTISEIAKFVWFGLNDEGYFIAIIPSSWSQIVFSTDTEGNLVLNY